MDHVSRPVAAKRMTSLFTPAFMARFDTVPHEKQVWLDRLQELPEEEFRVLAKEKAAGADQTEILWYTLAAPDRDPDWPEDDAHTVQTRSGKLLGTRRGEILKLMRSHRGEPLQYLDRTFSFVGSWLSLALCGQGLASILALGMGVIGLQPEALPGIVQQVMPYIAPTYILTAGGLALTNFAKKKVKERMFVSLEEDDASTHKNIMPLPYKLADEARFPDERDLNYLAECVRNTSAHDRTKVNKLPISCQIRALRDPEHRAQIILDHMPHPLRYAVDAAISAVSVAPANPRAQVLARRANASREMSSVSSMRA